MPIIQSAKKAMRQNEKNRSRNSRFKFLYKESVKDLEKAVENADTAEKKQEALKKVYSYVDRLCKKNILKKNTASRRKSKFARMLSK